ncbi:MAG: DNA-binding response regulator [Burkholderiales bacterium]|nr:MAG: DNA-binding response regulator [Burkholderiales bacterium]
MLMKPAEEITRRPIVLVVDDAPSSLGLLCDTLEGEGYTVLVARDGNAALRRLDNVVPDAILLDAVMPGLSGFETCRRIKANLNLAHIPVIFMTGLSETAHVVEGFECGGVDYVVKPLRTEEVVVRLQTHTRNARMARLARQAIDVAGFGVVLVDARQRIAWCSPRGALWLDTINPQTPQGWLPHELHGVLEVDALPVVLESSGGAFSIRSMGQVGLDEVMLLIEQVQHSDLATSRLRNASLTQREAQVLSWLAKGKTNRDIAEILGISHRTINKHLEHVFEKLGVETRSAAAALAVGLLA